MSTRWIDPRPAAVHLPGYRAWVQRRVEALNRAYIAGAGMPYPELVYTDYSEIGGGSGRHILPCHMEWLAKMWLLGGPRLPAPEPRHVPATLRLLGLLHREPALLGEWLLDLVAAFARDYGWRCRLLVDVEQVGLRTSRIRYYWEFLMGMARSRSPVDLGASEGQRELLAARVVRRLHRSRSLFHVLQGALALESREVRELIGGPIEVDASLLDDPTGTVLCGVAVRFVHQPGRPQHDAPRRSGILPEVEFVLWDPDEDVEASLGVAHVPGIGWRVAALKWVAGASVLEGSRVYSAAKQICRVLDQLDGLHPYLSKHMAISSAAQSWRRLGKSTSQGALVAAFAFRPTTATNED